MPADRSDDPEAEAEAIRWQEAVTAGTVDWNALTDWLEADAAHREAFSDIAQINDIVERAARAMPGDRTHVTGLRESLTRR
jgi:ferric-dicitrate binding protein FerR (iron transport regulator)